MFLFVALIGLAGCATVAMKQNPTESCTNGPPRSEPVFLYSGVYCDLQLINWMFTDSPGLFSPVMGVAYIIDLPLDVVADTVVLPWSVYQHVNRDRWKPPPEETKNLGKRPND